MANQPRIYTGTGDEGKTSLVSGHRISKSHLRIEAYGTVDELNSMLGVLLTQWPVDPSTLTDRDFLIQTQNRLFNLGSLLACDETSMWQKLPALPASACDLIEKRIDDWQARLPQLRNFVLPGGTPAAATAHVARTICRRAERHVVHLTEQGEAVPDGVLVFLNRLSDYLFMIARALNVTQGFGEPTWQKDVE